MYIKMLVFDSNGKLYATVAASNEEDYFAKQNEFKEFVKHHTVGQYTGLKDKNDKEIYEGDIIKWVDWSGHKRKTEVRYDEEWKRFCVWLNGAETIGVNKHLSDDIEVIGNKFDNPELTK